MICAQKKSIKGYKEGTKESLSHLEGSGLRTPGGSCLPILEGSGLPSHEGSVLLTQERPSFLESTAPGHAFSPL